MSALLRIFEAGSRKPVLVVADPGTVELVYSAPEQVEIPGQEGQMMPGPSTRRAVRLGDFDGPVKVEYRPPASAEPFELDEGDELVDVVVDARGFTDEQLEGWGMKKMPATLTMPRAVAEGLGKPPVVHVPERMEEQ
jgi:hypothetical protein